MSNLGYQGFQSSFWDGGFKGGINSDTEYHMDQDRVRLSLVLGPADNPIHVYSHIMSRWEARWRMDRFVWNTENDPPGPDLWDGKLVMRALIVQIVT